MKYFNKDNFQHGENGTIFGHIEEIVYEDHDNKVMPLPTIASIDSVGTIFLNCKRGWQNNDKFSFIIKDVAIPLFFGRYGILNSHDVSDPVAICDNTVKISQSGTNKPYCHILNEEDLNNLTLRSKDSI